MKKVGETFAVSHIFEWIFNRGEKSVCTHYYPCSSLLTLGPFWYILVMKPPAWLWWPWGITGPGLVDICNLLPSTPFRGQSEISVAVTIVVGFVGKAQRSSVDGGFNRSEKSLSKIIILYIYIYKFRSPGQKAVNLSQHISLNNQYHTHLLHIYIITYIYIYIYHIYIYYHI